MKLCRSGGWAIVMLLAVSGLWASSKARAEATRVPHVVATIKPIHSLLMQLMDGIATPTLLVKGTASPHTFTLRPSQAAALHKADLFVRVSEQIEPFTGKIVSSLGTSVHVLTLADLQKLTLYPLRQGGDFEPHEHDHAAAHDHDHHDGEAAVDHTDGHDGEHHAGHGDSEGQNTPDGHIWLDPANAVVMVRAMASELSRLYPQYRERFAANAEKTERGLEKLQSDIATQLAPVKGRSFIVFHDATQYFERRFHLEAAGAITLSPDVKPGARRLTDVRHRLQSLKSPCVFAEPGFQPKLLSAVAEGTQAKTATLDPEGVTAEAGKDAYANILRAMANSLDECLGR